MSTEHSDLTRSLELLWRMGEPPTRGPKPGLTRQAIVAAAIGVADREGLPALSMRRLATELGAGAMSLYRYVPGKAELIALMADEVYGEDLPDGPVPDVGWRAHLTGLARDGWAAYLRHPWMLEIPQGRPLLGPNAMRQTEFALRGLAGTGLDEHQMVAVVVTVGSFVAGLARTTVEAIQAPAATGVSNEDWWASHEPHLTIEVLSSELPMMLRVGEAGVWNSDFDTFAFGLDRLLDGFAALIDAAADPADDAHPATR